jgi:hypothetical protein
MKVNDTERALRCLKLAREASRLAAGEVDRMKERAG